MPPDAPVSRGLLVTGITGALYLLIYTLTLDVVMPNFDDFEDAFEWVVALLLQIYFITTFWTWKSLDQYSLADQQASQ